MIEQSMTAMLIADKNKRADDRKSLLKRLDEMEDNNKAQKEREGAFIRKFDDLLKTVKELQELCKEMFSETDNDGARISMMREMVEILFDEEG